MMFRPRRILILCYAFAIGGISIFVPINNVNAGEIYTYTKQKININQSANKALPQPIPESKVIPEEIPQDIIPESVPKIIPEIIIEKSTYDATLEIPNAPEQNEDVLIELPAEIPAVDNNINVLESEYILGAEDKIKITVFGEKDLSGDYKLGGDGTIAIPLIGVINLQNLSLRQAERQIEEKLKDGYLKNPSVSIEVAESRPFYIMGEVRRPGSYNYINGMSVLQAVAISGGYTYRANQKTVDILRGNATPQEPKPYPPEAAVRAGDIIFVRERFF